ncbi:hypothetical protein EZV62_007284 [Acer yangbiense]|uniref:Ribosomal protein L18ae family n=1 Tax=Acer yangbiense TaxID=1000413 RepID=A0A5C7IB98_9ROSI|nr:hypothetical protein EZV62_007284 [Acer yangbiense]
MVPNSGNAEEKNNFIGHKLMEPGGVHDDRKEMVVQLHVEEGDFSLLGPRTNGCSSGFSNKPLSCFGCGIGWSLFLMGFAFPPLWYYGTVLYFRKYYIKDPRERSGLAASAIVALICSVAVLISLIAVFAFSGQK